MLADVGAYTCRPTIAMLNGFPCIFSIIIRSDTLNRELGKLFVWFSVNKLSINLSKTNYILFRNRSADTDLNICITTINVTRVQSSKFLGIIIDENLNWKPHIQLVKSKLSKTLSTTMYVQSFQTH